MKKPDYAKLAFYIAVPLAAGFIGSFFTASSIAEWYSFLNKPFFAPPDWLFAPVWTILYIMMGSAGYLASMANAEMKPYWIQLGLNGLWSPLFFGLRSTILGLIDIIALLIAIAMTINAFYKKDKTSAYLLVPYLIWAGFATALNFAIVAMN